MRSLTFFGISLFALPLTAVALTVPPHLSRLLTKHAWLQIPHGWEEYSTPTSDHPITLKIALRQDGIEQLVKALYEVSDPAHEKYGMHLSKRLVFSYHCAVDGCFLIVCTSKLIAKSSVL